MLVRDAIDRGCQAFDFLRGDEPYKAIFGAKPRPTIEFRVVPRLRRGAASPSVSGWRDTVRRSG